jgi:ketosteroid isomerase-like protein
MAYTGALEDRIAIRELLETYADAVCRVDAQSWGSTWAEDGVWEMPDYPEFAKTAGRAKIVETWKAAMSHYPGIIFVATPGSIEISGDRAVVRSYTSEVFTDSTGTVQRHRGRYDDIVVKRGGKWQFLNRVFRNIHRA